MESSKTSQLRPVPNAPTDLERVQEKLRDLGHDPTKHTLAVLPAFDRPLGNVSKQQRRAFADRIGQIATEYCKQTGDATPLPENLLPPSTTVAHACGTCRGYCCHSGGDHAHLSRQTFARVLANSDGLSIEDVVRAYLELVPEQHYKGSCVYHTDSGCRLPRNLRSDTCNHFHCSGVQPLATMTSDKPSPPTVVAAMKGEKIVRLVVIQDDDAKILFGK